MDPRLTAPPVVPGDGSEEGDHPSTVPAAEAIVLRDLIDTLLQENLFDFRARLIVDGSPCEATRQVGLTLGSDERYGRVPMDGNRLLLFRVYPQRFLRPYRLSRQPVMLLTNVAGRWFGECLEPSGLLQLLKASFSKEEPLPNFAGVMRDLSDAVTQTSLSLAATRSVLVPFAGRDPSLIDWERLAALKDRPFHPAARTKGGWQAGDYRRYSPEFGAVFGLDWVAVRNEFLASSPVAERDTATFFLEEDERRRLDAACASLDLQPAGYRVVPVHPWQMERVLPELYRDELEQGMVVPVARNLGRVVATSSVRTVAPVSGGPLHLKLPLGIYSLGALRLLPPRYLHNGEEGERLLRHLLGHDAELADRLALCEETNWWAFSAPDTDPFADKPGHLACLLRRYPAGLLSDPEVTLLPMSSLAVVTPDGRIPAIDHILNVWHRRTDDWVVRLYRQVCRTLVEVALLCFRHGVMPELHGQNVLLVLRRGNVDGILLRDHDTVRVHLPWLTKAKIYPPNYRVKPDTPNSLLNSRPETLLGYFQTLAVQVNLYAILDALTAAYHLDESWGWRVIRESIEMCLAAFPFSRPVAEVIRRQLLHSPTWPARLVFTPLLKRTGSGGGSMPSGAGELHNPLRAVPHDRTSGRRG